MNYEFLGEEDLIDLPLKRSTIIGKYERYPSAFYERKPLFAYDFIDLDVTPYSFSQNHLDNTDACSYFAKLKELSNRTINDLLNNSDHKLHFHIYPKLTGKQYDLIKQITRRDSIRVEETPAMGQIGLYTAGEGKADRNTGVKSPRIYFVVGEWAVLHVIFYDPFHEINPDSNNKTVS